jgi:hypothetical protein
LDLAGSLSLSLNSGEVGEMRWEKGRARNQSVEVRSTSAFMIDLKKVDADPTASSFGPVYLPVPTPFMCHTRAYDIPEVLGQRYQRPGLPQLAELTQNPWDSQHQRGCPDFAQYSGLVMHSARSSPLLCGSKAHERSRHREPLHLCCSVGRHGCSR